MAKIKWGVFVTGLQLDTGYKLEEFVNWLCVLYHTRQINDDPLGFTVTDIIIISLTLHLKVHVWLNFYPEFLGLCHCQVTSTFSENGTFYWRSISLHSQIHKQEVLKCSSVLGKWVMRKVRNGTGRKILPSLTLYRLFTQFLLMIWITMSLKILVFGKKRFQPLSGVA